MEVDPGRAGSQETVRDTYKEMKTMKIERYFSREETNPYDEIQWERRKAQITNEKGEVIFEQDNVEMPAFFSQIATNVVVSKYFKGTQGTPEREASLRQVVGRVTNTITEWGRAGGYFATSEDGDHFRDELAWLLLNQHMAFNSPVWFNVGVEEKPQCSACFINSVEDKMESILELAKTEGMLFKFGSGAGSNLSPLRSSYEGMAGGGQASGPVSFMKGYDAFAGVIKSGGKTRRAAKMVILNVDHPDIEDFIWCKVREERKARALIKQGYEADFNGEAYSSIFFQNANHSVRVTDDFMQAVLGNNDWKTRAVTDPNRAIHTYKARDLLTQISEAAWETGDPGLQFDTTINDWHTCPNTDRIHASNPCSEYMFLNDTACNLASLNLMKFVGEDGEFDVERFRRAVRITLLAMEVIVDNADYPTAKIAKNSHIFRPLGLGYANLGALLMSRGLPYDSEAGRAYAAMITAIMHGEAYRTSAEIARGMGPFKGYKKNRRPFLRVMHKHANALAKIDTRYVPAGMMDTAREIYDEMLELGGKYGYRNSQVTVLAPTGTIAFMMDCDTTGVEPDIALVKYKKLVGGGVLKMVNGTVPLALRSLGYEGSKIKEIIDYIDKHDTIEGAPGLKEKHLPVFDCAFKPFRGTRSIHYMGHVRMMGAVQPFLSGAISKTVNMPNEVGPDEIFNTYLAAWQMGLKAIAIYRDGCKASQPLNTSTDEEKEAAEAVVKKEKRVQRIKLPDERKSITHKFSVGGHEGYITVGMYENGLPGEMFITISKEGSVVSGLMDSFATAISISLQYGVPLEVLVRKFIHTRFEPSGFTNNREIPIASSIMDYIFRWLAMKFLPQDETVSHPGTDEIFELEALEEDTDSAAAPETVKPQGDGDESGKKTANGNGSTVVAEAERILLNVSEQEAYVAQNQSDAPPCPECGAIMVRSGSCHKCLNCGATNGCS